MKQRSRTLALLAAVFVASLVVTLITDPQIAREVFQSLRTLKKWVDLQPSRASSVK